MIYARSCESLQTSAKFNERHFHGDNTGSNPVGDAILNKTLCREAVSGSRWLRRHSHKPSAESEIQSLRSEIRTVSDAPVRTSLRHGLKRAIPHMLSEFAETGNPSYSYEQLFFASL